MKLTQKKLQKMILEEMSTYKMGPKSAWGRDWKEVKEREDDEGYVESPERRRKRLQAELNAKGLEQIKDAMENLSLDGRWLPLIKEKMNQHGWIVDYSLDDYTITFEGKKSRFTGDYNNYVWDLDGESPPPADYEGRN